MSKFILSNTPLKLIEETRGRGKSVISGEIKEPRFEFRVYYKSQVKDENIRYFGDDFIAVTGSLLYKNLRGAGLLKSVYEDYVKLGDSLRGRLIGNYAVIIKHNNDIIVFGEESYFYDIFYLNKDGRIIVSNDLYDIYQNVDGLVLDKHNILEQAYLNCIIGNESVLHGVRRLSGDQKLVLNLIDSSLTIGTMPVNWIRGKQSFEQAVDLLTTNLKKETDCINKTFRSTAICMTGGLDSRLSFSALMSSGCTPSLYYGKGNSSITNTHDEDFDACCAFAGKFGLPLNKMDWSTPSPIDKDWNSNLQDYGILYHAYAGSSHIMSSLEEIKEEYVTLGQVGELYRTLAFTENRKYFTVEEYVDDYYFPKNDAGKQIAKYCDNFSAFRDRLIEKYRNVCKRFSLDPDHMVIEDFFYLNLEYRANADNVMLNLLNRMRYCTWLLVSFDVIKQANVDVSYLKDSHYMICSIEKLCPECLDIPVFSHQQLKIYNSNKKKLEDPRRIKIRHAVTMFIPQRLKKCIIKRISKGSPNDLVNYSYGIEELFEQFCGKSIGEFNINRLDVTLLQFLYAFAK